MEIALADNPHTCFVLHCFAFLQACLTYEWLLEGRLL